MAGKYTNYVMSDDSRAYFPRWKTGLGLEPSIALAYACYFGLLGPAQMILDLNPDLATTEEQLELDLENSINRSENDLPRTAVEIAIIQGNNHISNFYLIGGRIRMELMRAVTVGFFSP